MHAFSLHRVAARMQPTELPYGVVMASGGAGQVAGLLGWSRVCMALTAIAMAQAAWIALGWLARSVHGAAPRWRFGLFTVALGLAVVAGNLQPVSRLVGDALAALAWLASAILACWLVVWIAQRSAPSSVADGTWFLAPAALLGDAVVVAGSDMRVLLWLAILTCLAGVAAYGCVLVASAWRLYRRGLVGSPQAPWWIAAGCGGLAAAALGDVATRVPPGAVQQMLDALVVATWVAGTLALVAVVAGCACYAWQRPRGRWLPVWTPVFSMAVYAAGSHRLALTSGHTWLAVLTAAAIGATLALWVINSALYLSGLRAFQQLFAHRRS